MSNQQSAALLTARVIQSVTTLTPDPTPPRSAVVERTVLDWVPLRGNERREP